MNQEKTQKMLKELDSIIADHQHIISYDRIVQEKLEDFRGALIEQEKIRTCEREQLCEQLEHISLLIKDLAIEEQRLIEESPAVNDNKLEEEAHSYFNLSAKLRSFADQYFKKCQGVAA